MKKIISIIFIIILPIFCFGKSLKFQDINPIMQRFFEHHIESKQLNEKIIKRTFKLYVDQFDPSKIYLLESEAKPYVDMNSRDAKKILENVKRGDFYDFVQLNETIQNSIIRSKNYRQEVEEAFIVDGVDRNIEKEKYTSFAKNEKELQFRQKNSIAYYYLFQKKSLVLDSQQKRAKVFALLENRLKRHENSYLFLNQKNEPMSDEERENIVCLYILKAFARSLDAHSFFFSEDEAYQMRVALEKQFQGVGLVLSESIEGVIITDIVNNSPAAKNGNIQKNDIIVEIDGKSLKGVSFEEVMEMMKDKNNDEIILGLIRVSEGNRQSDIWRVKLVKKAISMDDERLSYTSEPFANGIIGKLDLRSFYEMPNGANSETDLKKAIINLRRESNLKGLILDLRENAGGFLSQAIKVAGLFISNGVVVISKNSDGEVRYLRTLSNKSYYNGPLIILTSKLSASASEIVAQALQDYGVAVIVGDETTFGKGSIQYQTVTNENADVFFKVTVGRYYTVSGKSTQIDGVKADIVVPTIYSPYHVGERYLEYPLDADRVKAAYTDPLSDMDIRAKIWFKQNYIPNLQRKVTFWEKMLPTLKKNSIERLATDPNFQAFLSRQESIKMKQFNYNVDSNDYGVEDLQMQEAINILKDMLLIEAQSRKASGF